MEQIGFFDEAPGQKSSTRLQIFILVVNGIFIGDMLVGFGLYKYCTGGAESLGGIVTAASSYLAANVIPLIVWKSISKNQETKTT